MAGGGGPMQAYTCIFKPAPGHRLKNKSRFFAGRKVCKHSPPLCMMSIPNAIMAHVLDMARSDDPKSTDKQQCTPYSDFHLNFSRSRNPSHEPTTILVTSSRLPFEATADWTSLVLVSPILLRRLPASHCVHGCTTLFQIEK